MTDQVQSTTQKAETQVQELTTDELEHVGGGAFLGGVFVGLADGSVRNVGAADYVVWRKHSGL